MNSGRKFFFRGFKVRPVLINVHRRKTVFGYTHGTGYTRIGDEFSTENTINCHNRKREFEKMSAYGSDIKVDINAYAKEKEALIVDLRSDTVTKPSRAMREAMKNAIVGDDVFGEDPTVKELEQIAARMLGKEAALFVTSGTMGNLIAIMVHCNERGCEAYCGEDSHAVLHEQGGAAQIAGVTICPIPNHENGTFSLQVLESKLRKDRLHEPASRLVIVENTFNGQIIDAKWIDDLSTIANKKDLKLHMDGARLWNAVIGSGIPAKKMVEKFHSVTFCLSKGLGAPAGSLLCGNREFIERARRARKVLGGGMRQVGVLAAAGIVALEETMPMLCQDHEKAREMENAIKTLNCPVFRAIEDDKSRTNMVFLNISEDNAYEAKTFVNRLSTVSDDPKEPKIIVRALALTNKKIRLVFHRDITDNMLVAAVRKIAFVVENDLSKYSHKLG